MKANNILETIGNTPHVKVNKLFRSDLEVWVKVESFNPGGSIKDRIALAMIETAEAEGKLKPGTVIVEPTSGNTGIGLALVAAVKGYKLILVMPESMSLERRRILKVYGAELELTPREKGMKGAIQRATELTASLPSAWMPSQFENPANVRIHEKTTAEEILRDFLEGFDYLISGVGTGGHITGVAKRLKKAFPNLKVIAVEPELSPVLSGGNPGPPAIYDPSLIDEIITVSKDEAFSFARRAALEEGLFVGISSGSSLAAVNKKSLGLKEGSRILTFAYDTGERYLSVEDLF
jgi:cysteine synthase A